MKKLFRAFMRNENDEKPGKRQKRASPLTKKEQSSETSANVLDSHPSENAENTKPRDNSEEKTEAVVDIRATGAIPKSKQNGTNASKEIAKVEQNIHSVNAMEPMLNRPELTVQNRMPVSPLSNHVDSRNRNSDFDLLESNHRHSEIGPGALESRRSPDVSSYDPRNCHPDLGPKIKEFKLRSSELSRLGMDIVPPNVSLEHFKASALPLPTAGIASDRIKEIEERERESTIAVKSLKEKIANMEEDHHSTNEELQATLQELTDLQQQLADLQSDNARMGEEKVVLLESLCRQTEKLEDARAKVDTLQGLLLEEQPDSSNSGRDVKLVNLLKSAQEERESLLLKQEDLNKQLTELRQTATSDEETTNRLEERIKILESTFSALKAEKVQLEGELGSSKEESSALVINVNRLNTLLDHAKSKIADLEQTRALTDRSELEEVIDLSRKEKDNLETQVAHLQEQLSKTICDKNRLLEQVEKLQEELKVNRNNAKSLMSDMEYKMDQLKFERRGYFEILNVTREENKDLKVQIGCCIEDKKQLQAVLNETQKSLCVSEKQRIEMEKKMEEMTASFNAKNLEWVQFQNDLLITVRVANDMKTEAMSKADELNQENSILRDKLKSMETQIEKFKAKTPPSSPISEASASVLNSVQQDLASRRSKVGSGKVDNRLSVKCLIESIENATKHAKGVPASRSSSSTSMYETDFFTVSDSFDDDFSNTGPTRNPVEPIDMQCGMVSKKENTTATDIGEKDPLLQLAKHGGSKRNALLKWCQTKTASYKNIDITNFSTSWNDGLALCALLHTYLPHLIPYDNLTSDARKNFSLAFKAAESEDIATTLNLEELVKSEKPDWKQVMDYITAIYKHFES